MMQSGPRTIHKVGTGFTLYEGNCFPQSIRCREVRIPILGRCVGCGNCECAMYMPSRCRAFLQPYCSCAVSSNYDNMESLERDAPTEGRCGVEMPQRFLQPVRISRK
ncbi:hypothetical protein DPMN_159989 [Dreissena polymorpha]|uniref:Uncharacterized protein n=1 Tax=Dreissena polymorpha TaxID=45954 RepID=A0A9D4ELY0_DREPO|nr:hypothetical protein DPMN_159989 [Dreissena polymorpha]